MGLAQTIRFKSSKLELQELLRRLGYEHENEAFILNHAETKIELHLIEGGLMIHKSGDYFSHFGMLIEALGEVSNELRVSDHP